MEQTAPMFFHHINGIIIDYVILMICAITDPPTDNRGNKNLSVGFLLSHYSNEIKAKQAELQRLGEMIGDFGKKVKPARHKLIGHSDRMAILGGDVLGVVSDIEWNKFWKNLHDFIRIIYEEVYSESFSITSDANLISDTDGLLKALKQSAYFEGMLNCDNPTISNKCIKLMLG